MTTTAPEIALIPIKNIEIGENHRLPELEKKHVDELARSIDENGQLQPVQVAKRVRGEKFDLVFGKRRFLAIKKLGRDTIKAEVVDWLPSTEVSRRRAIENLHRDGLSIVEEALAVLQLIQAIKSDSEGLDDSEVYERAAELLGKNPRWIRDRAYLDRLSQSVQQLCVEGRLSLGHARELAKLADIGLQEQLARYAATNHEGLYGWTLEQTRKTVAGHLQNLKRARWNLDVPFAGKPACDGCPSNSANDNHLFEADDKPNDPVCVNKKCFEAKCKSINNAIDKAVEKVEADAAKLANDDGGLTISAIRKRAPKAAKASSFERAAKKAIAPESTPKTKPTATVQTSGTRSATTPEQQARKAYREIDTHYVNSIHDLLDTTLATGGRATLALCLYEAAVPMLGLWDQGRGRTHSLLRAVVQGILDDKPLDEVARLLVEALGDLKSRELEMCKDMDPDEARFLLKMLDVETPPVPPEEKEFIKDWLEKNAQAPAAKKVTKKTAKKKATKKKAKA